METQEANARLEPFRLEYGAEEHLDLADVAAAQEGKFTPLPPGWTVASGYRTALTVGFASPEEIPMPGGLTLGEGEMPQPVVQAQASIPMLFLFLERGQETCVVEVAETGSELARVWSASILQSVKLPETSLGEVGVGGPTAVIDSGDRLIRATYDIRTPVPRSKEEDYAHMTACTDGARTFVSDLLE